MDKSPAIRSGHWRNNAIVASWAVGHGIRGGRVVIFVVGTVEHHGAHLVPVLESNPRLDSLIQEHLFGEENLTRASDPVAVSAVPGVLAKAEV